jgi:hypothetical protein
MMSSTIIPGNRYLLDGKNEVVVLKPSNRSNSLFVIETVKRSVEIVARERLSSASKP